MASGGILAETIEAIQDIAAKEITTVVIERAVVGLFFTGVKLSTGHVGACATPIKTIPDAVCCPSSAHAMPFPGKMRGRRAADFLDEVRQQDGIRRAVGIATMNALAALCWERRPHREVELEIGIDAFDAADIRPGQTVVVVGAFVPFLRELKRMGQPYLVLEQDPATLKADEMPFYRHAAQARAVAPQADVLLVTGTTLLNDTLDEILAAARPDACKVVVGPTVGLVPDAYLRRGCSGSHRRFRLPAAGDRICDMLGIPEEDRQVCFTSSRAAGRLLDLAPLSKAEIEEQNADNLAMAAYFQRLFELRRREPGNDLTTHLVQAEEDGNKLTNEELTANIILLFGAGHETTVNLIGNGLLALHRNPDQLRLLKSDPSLMANAIEELLRYDSSVQVTGRTTLEDVDEIGGIPLERGQTVVCLLGSANRDPAVYPDPDRLDITRRDVRPLSFGGGIHYCVGAQLARIEGEIAIGTLLRRLPNLRLDDVDHPDWRQTFVLRGLNKLPARW